MLVAMSEALTWRTDLTWRAAALGMGVALVIAVVLISLAAPAAAKKRAIPLLLWAGLGTMVALLPWRTLARLNPGLVAAMRTSWPALIEQGILVSQTIPD